MAMQVTQIAACNRLHEVNERLARWLLMSADRYRLELGSVDAGISCPDAGHSTIERDGCGGNAAKSRTDYPHRGDVKIVDRRQLEEAAL